LLIAFFAVNLISAHEGANVSNKVIQIIDPIESKPEFPGGIIEFYKFISKQYRTPKVKGLVGKVYMSFIIEKDGSINEIKVLRDIGYGTGEEAIRVLKLSPTWKPGEQDEKKVRCFFSLPISIQSN
jgi:periplasmic protein TonB